MDGFIIYSTPESYFSHYSNLCNLLSNYTKANFESNHRIHWVPHHFLRAFPLKKITIQLFKNYISTFITLPNLYYQTQTFITCFQTNNPKFAPQKLVHWNGATLRFLIMATFLFCFLSMLPGICLCLSVSGSISSSSTLPSCEATSHEFSHKLKPFT